MKLPSQTRLLKLSERLSSKQRLAIARNELSYFANEFLTLEDGAKFSFSKHEYLIEPYQEHHDKMVFEKAAQMGITTFAFIKAFWGCWTLFPKGVIYFFPTKSDVSDFVRGRIDPLTTQNKIIQDLMKSTDNVGLKQIGKSFVYFRGMESKIGMKSVPADMAIYDEIDESAPNAKSMAQERLSHSEFKWELQLSNPSLPGYGIDVDFQSSDQRYWMLKCPHCGEYNCVEDEFPKCLLRLDAEKAILACKKCRKELDKSAGQWVAKYPDRKNLRGYHLSQLFSQFINPHDILSIYESGLNLTNFYNLKLGFPYVAAENRLTKQEVLDLVEPVDSIPVNEGDVVTMGVDQGKGIHVVVKKQMPDGKLAIIYLGIHQNFEDMDGLMTKYRVRRCVIDALPETRKAREFANRHKGKVYLNFYNINQKVKPKWDEEKLIVEENRTESLDFSHNLIKMKMTIIPRGLEHIDEYADQCSKVAKKLEEDEETGSKRYIYVKLGPDHFRHADNYATLYWMEKETMPRIRSL